MAIASSAVTPPSSAPGQAQRRLAAVEPRMRARRFARPRPRPAGRRKPTPLSDTFNATQDAVSMRRHPQHAAAGPAAKAHA
jgi:hypothetical protein